MVIHGATYNETLAALLLLAHIICFGRTRVLIIVVKHAQAQPSDVPCLILIGRNEFARKFPLYATHKTLAISMYWCAFLLRRPFFLYEILCNREDRYTEAAKVNMDTQNATVDSIPFMHAHTQNAHRFVVILLNRGDILSRSLQMTKIQRTEMLHH